MPKRPDDNDDERAGRGAADPEADAEEVPNRDAEARAKAAVEQAAKAAATLKRARVGSFVGAALDTFRRRRDGTDRPVPLPWKHTAEELRGGLWPGCYVLVGGTGTGKTQWALELAYHAVSVADPVPVVYVGLELDRLGVVARLAALGMHGRTARPNGSPLRVSWSDLCLGNGEALDALEYGPAGRETLALLDRAPFYLVTGEARAGWPYPELAELVAGLRAAHPTGPALVIVDFLQLVGSPVGAREELRERIGNAAYAARMAARDHRVTVLLLSATARGYYALFSGDGKADGVSVQALGDGDPARFLGTGKESGEVEYAADGVLALCRERRTEGALPPTVWLAVAKSRTGRAPNCDGWARYTFVDGTSFTEAPATAPARQPGGKPSKPSPRESDPDEDG